MTWPMANSQIDTSKKPSSGARNFMPRATKMVRMVHRVTTHTSAAKMNRGTTGSQGRESTRHATAQPPPTPAAGHRGGGGGRPPGRAARPAHRPGHAGGHGRAAADRL